MFHEVFPTLCNVAQRRLVASYRHFGTTNWFYLQRSCSPFFMDC